MALRIAVTVNKRGEHAMLPETLERLIEFNQHENLCDQCTNAVKRGTGHYCVTGAGLFEQILEQPDVKWVSEDYQPTGNL